MPISTTFSITIVISSLLCAAFAPAVSVLERESGDASVIACPRVAPFSITLLQIT